MKSLWFIFCLYTSINAIQLNINSIDEILVNSFSNVKSKSATILKQSLNPAAIQEFYQIWDQIESEIIRKYQAYRDHLIFGHSLFTKGKITFSRQDFLAELETIIHKWIQGSLNPFLTRNQIPEETLEKWSEALNDPTSSSPHIHKRMDLAIGIPSSRNNRRLSSKVHPFPPNAVPDLQMSPIQVVIHPSSEITELGTSHSSAIDSMEIISESDNDSFENIQNQIELEWSISDEELKTVVFPIIQPNGKLEIIFKQPEYDDYVKKIFEERRYLRQSARTTAIVIQPPRMTSNAFQPAITTANVIQPISLTSNAIPPAITSANSIWPAFETNYDMRPRGRMRPVQTGSGVLCASFYRSLCAISICGSVLAGIITGLVMIVKSLVP